jgi:predicted DNA-binding transcriptional regulator AlpA
MTDGPEYVRAPDIVRLTGMSLRTIRRWLADEILPSTKVRGARIVAMADLEAVLSASHDAAKQGSGEVEETDDESAA